MRPGWVGFHLCGTMGDDILVSALVQATPGSAISLSDPLPANCVPSIITTDALPMRPHPVPAPVRRPVWGRSRAEKPILPPRPTTPTRPLQRARPTAAEPPWAPCLSCSHVVLSQSGNEVVVDPVAFVPGSAGSAKYSVVMDTLPHGAICASYI